MACLQKKWDDGKDAVLWQAKTQDLFPGAWELRRAVWVASSEKGPVCPYASVTPPYWK